MRIETERLVLRRWRPDDVEALAAIVLHPEVAAWLGGGSYADVERSVERYEDSFEALGHGRFAVEDRATGELVGRVGIMREDGWTATREREEVGWVIARTHWGRGLATEAAQATIADAFDRVGLARVLSWTLPENIASRRVMEKCGLVFGGSVTWGGLDHVWFAIDRPAAA